MKTFFKILLAIIAAVLVVKLLPVTLALGCARAIGAALVLALGVSVLAVSVGVLLALVALLSPIWLPVIAIVGLVMLIKRCGRATA